MKCLFDGFKCPYYKEGNCEANKFFNCEEYWRYHVEEGEKEKI